MHLVIGHPDDSFCRAVMDRLADRRFPARLIATPFDAPARLSLRIDTNGSTSTMLAFDDSPHCPIESVFVRSRGTPDPAGWQPVDYAYIQAESQAAMLGWLAALDCPVVNRLNAELWYRPRTALLHWYPLLRSCGLRTPETIVTDSAEALCDFRDRLERGALPGGILKSLAQDNGWLVGPDDWRGVEALQAHGPVCLAEPHGAVRLLCIVGQQIIWAGIPSAAERALGDPLIRFARTAGLDLVEIALGQVQSAPAVALIDPLPHLEHFQPGVQDRIVEALTGLLTGCAAKPQMEALS